MSIDTTTSQNYSMRYFERFSRSQFRYSIILFVCFLFFYCFYFKKSGSRLPEFDAQRAKIIPAPSPPAKYPYIAAIVEFRSSHLLVSVILNILQHIPSSWPIQIFHGKSNYLFLKNSPSLAPYISSKRILLTQLQNEFTEDFIRNTNRLFTNISFWKQVQGDKVLFFQSDSVMCSNSPHKITDYLDYDYIGAPWDVKSCCGSREAPVSNGGFSFRNRIKTIQLLQITQWTDENDPIPEDLWFAINFRRYLNASIPPVDIAKTFAVESIFYSQPMAAHKLLLSYRNRRRLYKTCPEARLIPPYFFLF